MASAAPKPKAARKPATPPRAAERTQPTRPRLEAYGRWPVLTFLLALVLPVSLVFAATAWLVYVQMSAMANDMDRHEDQRTTIAIHGAFDSFLNSLVGAVSDEGTWDEAYLNVVVNQDQSWMDTTWGATARIGESYDAVLVTDQAGQIVFGETAQGAVHGTIDQIFPAARTMLSRLDHGIDATGDTTTEGNYAEDKSGLVALSAISIHRATEAPPVPADKRRILWLGSHITAAVLKEFAERYQVPLAHVTQAPGARESTISIADADDRPITRVAWVSERPGQEALANASANAMVALSVIGAVAALVLLIIGVLTIRKSGKVERRFTEVVDIVEQKTAEVARVLEKEAKAAAAAATPETNRAEGVFANNFDISYAPIFDLREERMVGAEALLRWKGQDGAMLQQEDLTGPELNALLQRLGILGVRRVLEETAKLPDLPVTVAVPPQILANGLFVEKLGGTLAVTHFPPERLLLAIDVSGSPPIGPMQEQIDDLKRRRVGLMLDQFVLGPGTLPLARPGLASHIRVARDLVTNLGDDPARAALIDATFAYAGAAGVTLAASHVVRREDAARLLRLGCRQFSGNLIAEPMSIGHLLQLSFMPTKRKAG